VKSKGSRRRARIVPGFDALEGRALLSGFSGSMAPGTAPSFAGSGAAGQALAMMSSNSPGACSSPPSSAAPGPPVPNAGPRPQGPVQAVSQPHWPPASSTLRYQQTVTPTSQPIGFVPGNAASPGAPVAIPPAVPPVASTGRPIIPAVFSPSPARSFEPVFGVPSPRPSKGPPSGDLVVAVASGVQPPASSALDPAPGDDQTVEAPEVVTSGSVQSVLFSLGYTALTVALTPMVTTPSDPFPRESDPAASLVAALRDHEPQQGSVEIAPSRLPAPSGAGLVTQLSAFRQAHFDECLARLMDTLGKSYEPAVEQPQSYPHLIQAALGFLAIEAARRWARRSSQKARKSRRSRFFPINGIS
jgi:hypothetical protein